MCRSGEGLPVTIVAVLFMASSAFLVKKISYRLLSREADVPWKLYNLHHPLLVLEHADANSAGITLNSH